MDILQAVQTYVNKFFTEVTGMKVLLLDSETVLCSIDWIHSNIKTYIDFYHINCLYPSTHFTIDSIMN